MGLTARVSFKCFAYVKLSVAMGTKPQFSISSFTNLLNAKVTKDFGIFAVQLRRNPERIGVIFNCNKH